MVHFCAYVYYQAFDEYPKQRDLLNKLFMHEIIHALGFSDDLFNKYVV